MMPKVGFEPTLSRENLKTLRLEKIKLKSSALDHSAISAVNCIRIGWI